MRRLGAEDPLSLTLAGQGQQSGGETAAKDLVEVTRQLQCSLGRLLAVRSNRAGGASALRSHIQATQADTHAWLTATAIAQRNNTLCADLVAQYVSIHAELLAEKDVKCNTLRSWRPRVELLQEICTVVEEEHHAMQGDHRARRFASLVESTGSVIDLVDEHGTSSCVLLPMARFLYNTIQGRPRPTWAVKAVQSIRRQREVDPEWPRLIGPYSMFQQLLSDATEGFFSEDEQVAQSEGDEDEATAAMDVSNDHFLGDAVCRAQEDELAYRSSQWSVRACDASLPYGRSSRSTQAMAEEGSSTLDPTSALRPVGSGAEMTRRPAQGLDEQAGGAARKRH